MAYYIGVDLGTTYTAAALARGGAVEVAALANHSTAVPSVVWVGENGDVLVGEAAQRRALTEPSRVAREFKRRLGDTTPLLLGGTPYSAEALSSKLLSWVVSEITRTEGEPPAGVAVTHPANWGAYKKDLLAQAVRLADLPAATTLTEPQAAAIFYASQQRVDSGDVVAVFDLGGGTFDAAVIRKVDDGQFDILGEPEGIERLGGIDFDDAVFAHVSSMVQDSIDALDPDDSTAVAAVSRLREECVAAKEVLSSDTEASIPVLLPNTSTEVRLTRAEFEGMIRPRIEDSIGAMRRSLATAEVEPKDIKAILLVGGSSRIPLVAQMVSAAFNRPVAVDAHPKNAIAMGAAIAARTAAGETSPSADVAEPELPVQPERDATAAIAGVLVGDELGGPPTTALPGSSGAPPPPPVHKQKKSKLATVLPALLGLALIGGGSYYMFGRDKGHDNKKNDSKQSSTQTGGGGVVTGGGGGTTTGPAAPHVITVTDPLLTAPPSGTGPFDSGGSTECEAVAAAANGLDPANVPSTFQTQCLRLTWDQNGAQELVVGFYSTSTDNSLGPLAEVLVQNSAGTWTPVLKSDGSTLGWSSATITAANLTQSNEIDPEFVFDFHKTDGSQQMGIVQSNNGTPELVGQTNPAYQPSLQIEGTKVVMYGSKTPTSQLRTDTIQWVSDKNAYYGVFEFITTPEPSSTL